ncbi:MAG TPA: hypothetical protein VMV69_17010 [Pirellulales bacterium]|nr:hypothetical protein [Pirellulales bacterium]
MKRARLKQGEWRKGGQHSPHPRQNKPVKPSFEKNSNASSRRIRAAFGRASRLGARGEKKLAKPYLYPTKASALGAQMNAALEEVLTRLKPGNPPRRISWSVPVRFCQFFLAQFRLRRSRDLRVGVRRRSGLVLDHE